MMAISCMTHVVISHDMDSILKLIFSNSNMAYPKKMAVRDYFVIFLRSAITTCNQKTMAIDRIVTCIFGDHGRIARITRIAAGSSEIK